MKWQMVEITFFVNPLKRCIHSLKQKTSESVSVKHYAILYEIGQL